MSTRKSTSNSPAEPRPAVGKTDYERLSRFRHRLRRFLRISEDLCQAQGLTALQYQLLLHVEGFPGRSWASVGELAERLQAKHHGVVALIDRCEKAGLVRRQSGQEDRRLVEVHLQAKGKKLLQQLATQHQPELQQLREELRLAD